MNGMMSEDIIFKTCSNCAEEWINQADFLADPYVELIGYQAHFTDPDRGLFLFNHHFCGSTIATRVADFRNLYDGPVYEKRMTGSDACPGYCLYNEILEFCPVKCNCAYVREIMQVIKKKKLKGITKSIRAAV